MKEQEPTPTPTPTLTEEELVDREVQPHYLLMSLDPYEKHFGFLSFPRARLPALNARYQDMTKNNPHWIVLFIPIGNSNSSKHASKAIYKILTAIGWKKFPPRPNPRPMSD
jgi:hypothetical protein